MREMLSLKLPSKVKLYGSLGLMMEGLVGIL